MLRAATSYCRTKWVSRERQRSAFIHWQRQQLEKWLAQDVPLVDFYSEFKGVQLDQLPIIDKSILMDHFTRFNTEHLSADQIWEQLKTSDRVGKFTVGASTGTSGNRGLFVISDRERFSWLGAILAKAIPDILFKQHRVAIILPRDTRLYHSAHKMRKIDLSFFDIGIPSDQLMANVEKFNPSIVVAPPKIWLLFAQHNVAIKPTRLFSAAETLDPNDRQVIEGAFKKRLDQIYMATEGLLAVSCAHGGLHLAEDSTFFEFEDIGDNLCSPLITTFARTTQILARYRLNDLLRLSTQDCSCGSPLRLIDEIVGRNDDVFHLKRKDGIDERITPDILRNTIVNTDNRISDFRLVQTGPNEVGLALPYECAGEISETVVSNLRAMFKKRGTSPQISVENTQFALETDKKLRRVRCSVADEYSSADKHL